MFYLKVPLSFAVCVCVHTPVFLQIIALKNLDLSDLLICWESYIIFDSRSCIILMILREVHEQKKDK